MTEIPFIAFWFVFAYVYVASTVTLALVLESWLERRPPKTNLPRMQVVQVIRK